MSTTAPLRVLLFCLLFLTFVSSRDADRERLLDRALKKALDQYQARRQAAWAQCSNQPQPTRASSKSTKDGPLLGPAALEGGRGRRATARSKDWAIYLDRSKGTWNGDEGVPEHHFTMSVWVWAEGGQHVPAHILDAEDLCSPFRDRGWSFGILSAEPAGERDLRLHFRLHSWSKLTATTLTSPVGLVPEQWVHVAATYDGETLVLYQNGAQVAISDSQSATQLPGPACRTLKVGGETGSHYRGRLDDFRLWNVSFPGSTVRQLMFRRWPSLVPRVMDDFTRLDAWDWAGNQRTRGADFRLPILMSSDVPVVALQPLQPKPNPCGFTICDSPEVSGSYRDHWMMRKLKVLRYRVVVLAEDDGTNPTVTKQQISAQHEYLQRAYERYNITWQLNEYLVMNSTLRRRSILLSCDASMVGNGQCDPECRHPSTGNDGGDCNGRGLKPTPRENQLPLDDEDEDDSGCLPSVIGNGVCDNNCNVVYYDWDGGDCCVETSALSCFDPRSPLRSYMDVRELKSALRLKNTRHINVLFAHWTNRDILGVATFPWEKNVLDELGGIILQPSGYGLPGQMSTLVHELGHALGLWHVHRGVSEMDCSHPCFEREATAYHGDLCQDTKPTPENLHCQDPPSGMLPVCGRSRFTQTPYRNFMGYADDYCVQDFTAEQVARMHCHIDLVYHTVRGDAQASVTTPPPPILLSAVASTGTTVTLSWVPPLAVDAFYDATVCSSCSRTLEFSQFAHRVEASDSWDGSSDMYAPHEATGPPDSEPCLLSYKVWIPESTPCLRNICTLTAYFEKPVAASLLQIWVTWNAQNGLQQLEVVFQDGTSDVFTRLRAQCDFPISVPLFSNKTVAKVHIRTASRYVGIDAIRLVSVPNNPICSPCKPLKYRVHRDPPFEGTSYKDADYPLFSDSGLDAGAVYVYRVQSWLGNRMTDLSPAFTFSPGSPVCGDGKLSEGEFCDDGGVLDGDGCSSSCKMESNYYCTGEPSFCYWHESDGRCEDFERESSPADCGFYTPKGFADQWASDQESGPKDMTTSCPPESITGPPSLPFVCRGGTIVPTSWSSCDHDSSAEFWLTARFRKPAVATSIFLYLTSDGTTGGLFEDSSAATVSLLGETDSVHHQVQVELMCSESPQKITIYKDLSEPFSRTAAVNISFSNVQIEIVAVKLRSSNILNPVGIRECSAGEQYHPGLQKCNKFCEMPTCPRLPAKHAVLNCTGFRDGDFCVVACYPGYQRPANLPPLVCQAGDWVGPDPHCKPVDCGAPLLAHADAICPEGTTYGRNCSYKCRPPARFVGGGSGLSTISCEPNGRWSSQNIACQLTCLAPFPPAHAVLASPRCRKAETFLFGETCRFRCKTGYHVDGQTIRKRILYRRCDLDRQWSGPRCVPVTCDPVEHLSFNCTNLGNVGSECRVKCQFQDSSTTSHKCELSGMWSPPLPICISPTTCAPPRALESGVKFLCEGNLIGSVCKATCRDPDQQPVKDGSLTEKIRITCLPGARWVPDPAEVQCKRRCAQNSIGDGHCDIRNNEPHCDFDGGDC